MTPHLLPLYISLFALFIDPLSKLLYEFYMSFLALT